MTVNGIKAENTELQQEVARLDKALAIETLRSANLASEKANDRAHYRDVCRAQEEAITRLTAENERLTEWNREIAVNAREFAAEVTKLRAALDLYRDAVRIDATMEGPKFMGSNASALKRAWDADRAAITQEKRDD